MLRHEEFSHRKTLPSFGPSSPDDILATFGCHANQKAMRPFSLCIADRFYRLLHFPLLNLFNL
jgi:hypothetical protein